MTDVHAFEGSRCGAPAHKLWISALAVPALMLAIALPATAAPQASLTLKNSDVALCHYQSYEWTVGKTANFGPGPIASGTSVTWTIDVSKGAAGPATICVYGIMEVANTGSAPATIGNIVVNLQRQQLVNNKTRWVSASVDVADATDGDGASSANILAAASAEDPGWNAMFNLPATYAVSGKAGEFTENAGSGALEFTDFENNTIWAITPQQTIPVGGSVKLLFKAMFDNDVLGIPDGALLRTETIVSFGNAGLRGGAGSVGTNIDINGNGITDTDEANVRSVPMRITEMLPNLEPCNDGVTFSDEFTGDAVANAPVWSPSAPPQDLNGDGPWSWTVTAVVTGADGDSITNTAMLTGTTTNVSLIVGYVYNEATGLWDPVYKDFPCCVGTNESSSSSLSIAFNRFDGGDYCTYFAASFGGTAFNTILTQARFNALFPSGLTIGINDGPGTAHHALWQPNPPTTAGLTSLKSFFNNSANGFTTANGKLTATTTNATTTSGGHLPKVAAGLTMNIAFSDNGVPMPGGVPVPTFPPGFGDLKVCGTGTSFDGITVRDVLLKANQALGGTYIPTAGGPYFACGTSTETPCGFNSYQQIRNFVYQLTAAFAGGEGGTTVCNPNGPIAAKLCE